MPPVRFREGDIVDAKLTLMLVPVKNDQHKMVAILRSLTLLDSTYSQVSTVFKKRTAITKRIEVPGCRTDHETCASCNLRTESNAQEKNRIRRIRRQGNQKQAATYANWGLTKYSYVQFE
jgi:hypothetical protein